MKTPLFAACYDCRVECVRALLNARADPMEASEDGDLPIDVVGNGRSNPELLTPTVSHSLDLGEKVIRSLIERAMQERYEEVANELAERVVAEEARLVAQEIEAERLIRERKDAARKEKERAKKQAKQRREQARQKASEAAGMSWSDLESILNTSLTCSRCAARLMRSLRWLRSCRASISGARERLQRLDSAEELRLANEAAAAAAPMDAENTSLVRGEDAAALVHEGTSRCSICLEVFASDLSDRCIAVLPCRHAICACLVEHRMQSRRLASEEIRADFISPADDAVYEENSSLVPVRPETVFQCTECKRPIADDIVEQLASALFDQESFLNELSSGFICGWRREGTPPHRDA